MHLPSPFFYPAVIHDPQVGGRNTGILKILSTQLELDPPTSPSLDPSLQSGGIMRRMTFTYGLGERHGLYEGMKAAQVALDDN